MPSFFTEKCQTVNLFVQTGPLRCSEAPWGNFKTSQIFFLGESSDRSWQGVGAINVLEKSLIHQSHHNVATWSKTSLKKQSLSILALREAGNLSILMICMFKIFYMCVHKIVRQVLFYWVNNSCTKISLYVHNQLWV